MLNEISEYKEYTDKKNIGEDCRLRKSLFFEKKGKDGAFCGLQRPLQIIARYHLFNEWKYEKKGISERKTLIDDTKEILRSWCGLEGMESSDAEKKDFAGWLRCYYEDALEDESYRKNLKSWEEVSIQKTKQFDKELFGAGTTPNSGKQANDFKAISFEKIIADAICRGPLSEYYLICKENYDENLYYRVESKYIIQPPKYDKIGDDKKKDKEYKQNILRGIAWYLLSLKYTNDNSEKKTEDETFIEIEANKTDLCHWIGKSKNYWNTFYENAFYSYEITRKDKESDKTTVEGKFERIFSSNHKDNISKVKINGKFLKKYGFRLLNKEDYKGCEADEICFCEPESGELKRLN